MGEKKRKRMLGFRCFGYIFVCHYIEILFIIYDFMTCRAVTMYEGYGSTSKSYGAFVPNAQRANEEPLQKEVDEKLNVFFCFFVFCRKTRQLRRMETFSIAFVIVFFSTPKDSIA